MPLAPRRGERVAEGRVRGFSMKQNLGPDAVLWLAGALELDDAFVREALDGLDALELTDRARHIGDALGVHLGPDAFARVMPLFAEEAPHAFAWWPLSAWIETAGLADFEAAMRVQHALTQRFTAEFSIRAWLRKDPARTLARLAEWTADPSEHVRRLVSEGTRPRLPWAARLDGVDAVPLLDHLVDDPSPYVRRSVANHLGDLAKDDPDRAVALARRWGNAWVARHGLRWLVKRGHPGALALLGAGAGAARVSGTVTHLGLDVEIAVEVVSEADQRLVVDYVVHFAGARGPRPKVFKLATLDLAEGEARTLRATVSLRPMTTRRVHPGEHRVDVRVNGRDTEIGRFVV
jgi:3-methyladenine DNA glycosylase AlkC